jgi:hypothetical protein
MQKQRERFLLEIGIMVLLNKYFIMIASSYLLSRRYRQTLPDSFNNFLSIYLKFRIN